MKTTIFLSAYHRPTTHSSGRATQRPAAKYCRWATEMIMKHRFWVYSPVLLLFLAVCNSGFAKAPAQQVAIEKASKEMDRIQKKAYRILKKEVPIQGQQKAQALALDYLKAEAFVERAGVTEGTDSIWIVYKNGMQGGVTHRKEGYK